MTLSELINALEKAEQGSRELDFWLTVRVWEVADETDEALQDDIDIVGIEEMWVEKPFTSSIDAAMDLAIAKLDDGAVDIEVAHRVVGGKPHGRAEICGPRVFGMAISKTPAMALVLATLKALHARGDA